MLSQDIERFIAEYIRELDAGTAAVFAGAGLSVGAGFVDWAKLLDPVAKELGLDSIKEQDQLVALAQYHVNQNHDNRSELHKRLLDEFPAHHAPSENHRILARLPIPVFWTTNYDRLIERALEDAGKIPDVKYTKNQLAYTKPRRDAVVYKMHGDVEQPDQAVLTKDDYERYATDRAPFVTALSGDLVSRTFLFLGFSFKDPNLDYVLARIRIHMERNGRRHYCVMRQVQQDDFGSVHEFNYANVKQQLAIEDLKRFNIKTLLVDDYAQITELLRTIEAVYRKKTIFVSGSAEVFGNWKEADVEDFLADLGRILVDREYRIVSGFGWGISNALLSGATEKIYSERKGHFEDFLTVRPFPRYIADPSDRMRIWTQYRKDMIQRAGVALFLFGNKQADGRIVLADGVVQEFEIAQEYGLELVPVGATGFVAEELGRRILGNLSNQSANYIEAFQRLQEPVERPQELSSRIIDLLDQLNARD
jgi:hypothetical protein